MSMKPCHECGGQVSTEANACPHCGTKVKKPIGVVGWVFAGVVVIGIAQCSANTNPSPPPKVKTAAQIAADAAAETRFQMAVALAKEVKRTMRDPDSFVIETALANEEATVFCLEYRAQNGFGGMNREVIVIHPGGAGRDAKHWNKYCTAGNMRDMGHIRQALK